MSGNKGSQRTFLINTTATSKEGGGSITQTERVFAEKFEDIGVDPERKEHWDVEINSVKVIEIPDDEELKRQGYDPNRCLAWTEKTSMNYKQCLNTNNINLPNFRFCGLHQKRNFKDLREKKNA